MKRILSAILVISLCFASVGTLCACDNSNTLTIDYTDTYIENQDYQYYYADGFGHSNFQKTDNGYYASIGHFIYYIDSKTMKATPLCNKSDCLHDKETSETKQEECQAYVNDSVSHTRGTIQYYNNKLYVVVVDLAETIDQKDKYIFCEINPENGERKEIFAFDEGAVGFWAIHRGSIYFQASNCYDSYANSDTEESSQNDIDEFNKMFKVSLGDNKAETIYDFKNRPEFYRLELTNSFYVYGNHLYIQYDAFKSEEAYKKLISTEDEDLTGIEDDTVCGYIEIDIKNNTSQDILLGDWETTPDIHGFYNGKMYYKIDETEYYSSLDATDSQKVADNIKRTFLYDGKRAFESCYDPDQSGQDVQTIISLDENYNEKSTFTMPDNFAVEGIIQILCPFDEKYIWGFIHKDDSTDIVYIDKSQLDGDGKQLKAESVYTCNAVYNN